MLLALATAAYLAFWREGDGGSGGEPGSIAVLVRPFQAEVGADASEQALASGITDELVVRLRSIPELKIAVAGPDGGSPADFADAYVVEGKIRTQGDILRLTANLMKPSGEILWSNSFNRRLADIFFVQQSLALEISDVLSVSFDVGGWSRKNGGTNNPQAYAEFIEYTRHTIDPDQTVAMAHLRRALELDPGFQQASAPLTLALGVGLVAQPFKSEKEIGEVLAQMDGTSAELIERNPDVPEAHFSRIIYHLARKDFTAASAEQAIAFGPNGTWQSSMNWSVPTIFALAAGRVSDAGNIMQQRAASEPLSNGDPFTAFVLEMQGQHRAAIKAFESAESVESANLQTVALQIVLAH